MEISQFGQNFQLNLNAFAPLLAPCSLHCLSPQQPCRLMVRLNVQSGAVVAVVVVQIVDD